MKTHETLKELRKNAVIALCMMAVVVVGTVIVMLGRGANDRHATGN
jgi:hypothetical protein